MADARNRRDRTGVRQERVRGRYSHVPQRRQDDRRVSRRGSGDTRRVPVIQRVHAMTARTVCAFGATPGRGVSKRPSARATRRHSRSLQGRRRGKTGVCCSGSGVTGCQRTRDRGTRSTSHGPGPGMKHKDARSWRAWLGGEMVSTP